MTQPGRHLRTRLFLCCEITITSFYAISAARAHASAPPIARWMGNALLMIFFFIAGLGIEDFLVGLIY
jgi:hypothetical protein